MMLRARDVRSYNFTSKDQLFLDANIWLYVYAPQKPRHPRVAIYSEMFKRIIAAESHIHIDVLVVSEFINAYARMKWRLVRGDNEKFKEFRNSSRFTPIAEEIADSAKRVISQCSRIESGFETLNADNLLDVYSTGNSDFNDQVIAELCKSKELTLVTDDSDFKGQRISVLTGNRHLLNSL